MPSGAYLHAEDLRPGLGYGLRFAGERNGAFYVVERIDGDEVVAWGIKVKNHLFQGLSNEPFVGKLHPGKGGWRPDATAAGSWEGAVVLKGETVFAEQTSQDTPTPRVRAAAQVYAPFVPGDVRELDEGITDLKMRAQVIHARLQNQLAEEVSSRGLDVLRGGGAYGLDFDLAWLVDDTMCLVDIKSITFENEKDQIRYGIGQLYDYQVGLRAKGFNRVEKMLFVEYEPDDPRWQKVCEEAGVLLFWPERMKVVLDAMGGAQAGEK